MATKPKDLFSSNANNYAHYRPTYPDSLFAFLASLVQVHSCAWDVATGNGQAALKLTKHFDHVMATDLSNEQLKQAKVHPKITFSVATAETSGLNDKSVDLITVAQAFHWFDAAQFSNEARRVGKKDSILAIWCYDLATISPEIDAIVNKLCYDVLADYWEKERVLVTDRYQNVSLPFSEIVAPTFQMTAQWSFEHLMGYINTWSALQTYRRKNHRNPLDEFVDQLRQAFSSEVSLISWELKPRIWRIG